MHFVPETQEGQMGSGHQPTGTRTREAAALSGTGCVWGPPRVAQTNINPDVFTDLLTTKKGVWLSFGKKEQSGIILCHCVTWGQLFNLFKPHFQHPETETQKVALSQAVARFP